MRDIPNDRNAYGRLGGQFMRCRDGIGETPVVATFGAPHLTAGIRSMIASSTQIKQVPSRSGLIPISSPMLEGNDTICIREKLTTT